MLVKYFRVRFCYQYGKFRHFICLWVLNGYRGDKNALAYSGELRIDNDIKQEVLAELLNVTVATYSRYENGKRAVPIPALKILAEFYNTTVDYLIG